MNWQVEWLDEAKKDMRKLGKAEQIQVLKGIEKVRTNPLPTSQGGYGKPLRNAERTKLSRLCKIKFRVYPSLVNIYHHIVCNELG